MSFLDKVKAQANNTPATAAATPAAQKSNPLIKNNPLLTKKPPETPAAAPKAEDAPAPAEKKANPLLANKKPLAVPTISKTEEKKVEETPKVEEKAEGPKKIANNPFIKPTGDAPKTNAKEEDPIAEAGAQKAVEAANEELEKKEEVKVETTDANVEQTTSAKTSQAPTPVVEKNNSKKKTGSKKTTDTVSVKEEIIDSSEEAESISIVIPQTSVGYAEALEGIKSNFSDEEWDNFKAEVEEKLAAIVIAADMTPATLKQTLANLSEVRSMIEGPLDYFKNNYEDLASEKPEGLIMQVKGIAYTNNDKNDMDRRRAGIIACMNYVDKKGNTLNLYEVLSETRERYNFLQSKMNAIQFKSSSLITMNGALKLEENLTR